MSQTTQKYIVITVIENTFGTDLQDLQFVHNELFSITEVVFSRKKECQIVNILNESVSDHSSTQ